MLGGGFVQGNGGGWGSWNSGLVWVRRLGSRGSDCHGFLGWGSRYGGVMGLGLMGSVSMCHSIDRFPKLWMLHLYIV